MTDLTDYAKREAELYYAQGDPDHDSDFEAGILHMAEELHRKDVVHAGEFVKNRHFWIADPERSTEYTLVHMCKCGERPSNLDEHVLSKQLDAMLEKIAEVR